MKKQADKIKRVGLIGNSEKAACADIVRKAARLISRAGRKVAMNPDTAALAREVDLLLVFGGDGTMLRAARDIAGSATPLLGINIGGLGFLTAVPSNELPRALESHLARRIQIRIPRADRSQRALSRPAVS